MSSKQYSLLPANDETSIGDVEADNTFKKTRSILAPSLAIALLFSVGLNLYSLLQWPANPQPTTQGSTSLLAELAWDYPTTLNTTSRFNDADREIEDAAWGSDIVRPQNFVVALEDSFTESKGVLHSMRWPWDHGKGVYVLTSGHELHCLHTLREVVNNAYDQKLPSWPRPHVIHCLDYLLRNVMCYADDTPLYTGFLHASSHATVSAAGEGDVRMCRNWGRLLEWVKERSACYDPYYKSDDPNITETDRYKVCPDDRRPWERSGDE